MKTLLTIFLTTLIYSISFGQQPDQVLARVRYTYISKIDTLKNGKPRTENMLLFIGKNASLYTSYDKINYEIAEDQKRLAGAITRTNATSTPTLIKIDRSAGEWLSKTNNFFFQKEKQMFTLEVILQGYLIEEPIAQIDWKITKDTVTLSGVACQKAIANYEGKNWVAWFAPSLPFQSGPWKLQGLPGLILEAHDVNLLTQFKFAGFEKASEGDFVRANDLKKKQGSNSDIINPIDVGLGLDVAGAYFDNIIQLPTYRIIKTTRKELDKLKDAYKKDPKGFSKAIYGF